MRSSSTRCVSCDLLWAAEPYRRGHHRTDVSPHEERALAKESGSLPPDPCARGPTHESIAPTGRGAHQGGTMAGQLTSSAPVRVVDSERGQEVAIEGRIDVRSAADLRLALH